MCSPRRVPGNKFDEKTMHWKIKLQVASILIRFMWCHFNWKCILHKSDEIIWTWLVFPRIARSQQQQQLQMTTLPPQQSADQNTRLFTQICIWLCEFLALIVCKPQGSGGVKWTAVCSSKLYCSAPCTIELKSWAEFKKNKTSYI